MNSIKAAWKAFRNPALLSANTRKFAGSSFNLVDLMGTGGGTQDRQLSRNVFGATLAYQTVPEVKSALDVIAENMPIVPLIEKDAKGNVVARSDENPEASPLIMAVLDSQDFYGIPLLSLVAYALKMPGMSFIEITRNQFQLAGGLKWLNPQRMEIWCPRGDIEYYYYTEQSGERRQLLLQNVISLRDFNPADDIYGYGTTLNIMGKANAVLDFDRMKISYYRNGAQPGIVVNFKNPTTPEEAEKHIKVWRNTMRGVDNFFKTHFSSIPADITTLDPIDISKPMEVTIEDAKSILKGYRVAPEMIGDTTNNPYQFSAEKRFAFMLQVIQPIMDKALWGINSKAAPRLAKPGHKLYADFDMFKVVTDTEKAKQDMFHQDWQNGRISWNEYRQGNNYAPVPGGDFYMLPRDKVVVPVAVIDGKPQLPDIQQLVTESNQPLSNPATLGDLNAAVGRLSQRSQPPLLLPSKAINGAVDGMVNNASPAYAYIPLRDNLDVLRIQRQLKERLTDARIEWQIPATFHVTLCYADGITDTAIANLADTIRVQQMKLQSTTLNVFETPDGKALHIALDVSNNTRYVQQAVYQQFWATGQVINDDHFESEQWKPHITLAYLPNDIPFLQEAVTLNILADSVAVSRDDYDPVLVLKAPQFIRSTTSASAHTHDHALPHRGLFISNDSLYDIEAIDTATAHELRVWYKYAKARKSADARCGFSSTILEPYIRHAVIDRLDSLAVDGDLSAAIIDVLHDDVIKTVGSYRRQARTILNGLWRGSLGFADAVGNMTSLIEQQFTQAFIRGIAKNSLSFNDLDADEQSELKTLIYEEKAYVLTLIADIYKARSDANADIATFRNRIEMWVARYDRVEERAFVIAARNARLKWIRDPRKESCDDCILLDGMVKLAKEWRAANIEPKSPRLKCFGAFCGCGFGIASADTPLSKGEIPSIG